MKKFFNRFESIGYRVSLLIIEIRKIHLLVVFVFSILICSPAIAFANDVVIEWEFDKYTHQFGAADKPNEKVRFFVSDPNLANNMISDSIEVVIDSTSLMEKNPDNSPKTIDSILLTLEEIDDAGTFQNENLVFLKSIFIYPLDQVATLQIIRECTPNFPSPNQYSGNCNSNQLEVINIGDASTISSSSNPSGINVQMREFLEPDSSLFFSHVLLSSNTSSESLAKLKVSPGDVITLVDSLSLKSTNSLVEPINEDIGGILTEVTGSNIIVNYKTKTATTVVLPEDKFPLISEGLKIPGRGGGGAVNRGLLVDSGGLGDIPPTLGVDSKGRRLVENGFSYNGNPVNVQEFFTSYDLVKTETGKLNQAELKIFDDKGPDGIEFVGLAFGLSKNQYFGDSDVSISLTKTLLGQKVTTKDPKGILSDVDVKTTNGPCDKTSQTQCLIVTFYHKFKSPLKNQVIGTYIWDKNHSAWQNFFNHGIKITGESTIPPVGHAGINKGKLVQIFETGENTAVDKNGNTWIFNKEWKIKVHHAGKIDDGVTSHGIDRNNVRFEVYKNGQELLAQQTLNIILGKKEISNTIADAKTIYNTVLSRSEDLDLQRKILYEESRAREQNAKLFDFKTNH